MLLHRVSFFNKGQVFVEETKSKEPEESTQEPAPQETTPQTDETKKIDSWIMPRDHLPLTLALSLYSTPIESLGGFTLQEKTNRAGVWMNEQGDAIVGLRGTSPGGTEFSKDLLDDWKIATSKIACGEISLVNDITIPDTPNLIFVGHSLGGTAAMCLGNRYPTSRVIALNAGAPPTNPMLTGPGPNRATHYHVMGDAVSSHMSPQAAQIIRIEKIGKPVWLSTYPHSSDRIYVGDGPWKYVTADDEQRSWVAMGKIIPYSFLYRIVCENPIPGSSYRC